MGYNKSTNEQGVGMSERSKSPKVSVISISYNQEGFIAQTLESFLMQVTDFEVEIIIADDCSTDNTAKIIDSYAKKHPSRIKPVLRPKNVGVQVNTLHCVKATIFGQIRISCRHKLISLMRTKTTVCVFTQLRCFSRTTLNERKYHRH